MNEIKEFSINDKGFFYIDTGEFANKEDDGMTVKVIVMLEREIMATKLIFICMEPESGYTHGVFSLPNKADWCVPEIKKAIKLYRY